MILDVDAAHTWAGLCSYIETTDFLEHNNKVTQNGVGRPSVSQVCRIEVNGQRRMSKLVRAGRKSIVIQIITMVSRKAPQNEQ